MKILFILFIFIFSSVYAADYMQFHNFIYGKKAKLKPKQTIEELLTVKGYDIKRKKWEGMTREMNGLDASSFSVEKLISLPRKISFQDHLEKLGSSLLVGGVKHPRGMKRTPASTSVRHMVYPELVMENKPLCRPVNHRYVWSRFKRKKIQYDEYFDLISSRKVFARKGDSLTTLLMRDRYRYPDMIEAIRKVKGINKMLTEIVGKDGEVALPFCINTPERKVASVHQASQIMVKKAPETPTLSEENSYSVMTQAGQAETTKSRGELSTKFFKVGGKYSHRGQNGYRYSVSLAAVKFSDISYTFSEQNVSPSNLYPEFGVGISKSMGRLSLGAGYDQMNYFLVTEKGDEYSVRLTFIHKLSFKPYYQITSRVGAFGSLGYAKTFGLDSVSGFEGALGMSYQMGPSRAFSINPLVFRSKFSGGETSEAVAVSLAYRF